MILSLLAAAAVAAAPATAAPSPKPADAAQKTAPLRDDQKIVCTTEPKPGSRLTVKRCATVADLRARGLLDRQELEHMQQDRTPGY